MDTAICADFLKISEYIEESFRRSCDDLPVQDVLNIYEDYQ